MIEKEDVLKYFVVGILFVSLLGVLLIFRGGPTGFAVFQDSGNDFDLGTYSNTEYNGSAVVLSGDNLTGTYTSQVFDAGNEAVWNNINYVDNEPNLEFLFSMDNSAGIWESIDQGVTLAQISVDYNPGIGNLGGMNIVSNSSGSLFVVNGKSLWASDDLGVNWRLVNDNINGDGDSNNAVAMAAYESIIYVIDGSEDVLRSEDNGVSFAKVNDSDFNGGNGDVKTMVVDNSGVIFVADAQASVWKSTDSGETWSLVNEDYNGGIGNGATDMEVNSSNVLFILYGQDLWHSIDSGITWQLTNDDFNGGPDSGNGQAIAIDSNDYIYIADGSEDIYKSEDSGGSFTRTIENFNGGDGMVKGLDSFIYNSSLTYYIKSCDDAACSGEEWVEVSNPLSLGLSDNRYFQYKVEFTSPDSSVTPSLTSMSIDYDLVNAAPSLTLVSPSEGDSYGYNESLALDFIVSDADNNLNSCWYTIDGGVTNNTIVSCVNTTFDVSEGSHDLYIYANDSLGLESSDTASFSVAVGSPSIVLNYPINVYFSLEGLIQFNYTPTDVDLDSCELWGNFDGEFKLNQTDSSPTSGSENTFSLNLGDGIYLWNIRCVDDIGNSAFNGNKTFYIDTINPIVSLIEPTGSKTSRTVSASWSITDNSPVSCNYNVYRGSSIEVINTSINCSLNAVSFIVTVDANFMFNLYVNDSAGNSNSKNSSFSVDTSTPITPPSSGGGGGGGGGSITNITGKLEVSQIGNMIARRGDKKTLSLNVKNTGRVFLNNCRLVIKGDINSWIYSTQKEGIAPGENVDFSFDLNVPEEIGSGDYGGKLEIKCDEGSNSQDVLVSVPGLGVISVGEIVQEKSILKIGYDFDNSNVVGEKTSVDVWVLDEEGYEITRFQDVFDINVDGPIKRNVEVEFEGEPSGVYYVYFALSDDLSNFVRKSVVLGKTETTGFIIFDAPVGKGLIYVAFLVIIVAAVYFIWKRQGKEKRSEHLWLLRKKAESKDPYKQFH